MSYVELNLPFDFWTVSRVIDGRQVYLAVTSNDLGLDVGDGPEWQDSLCQAMWELGAPQIVPDVETVPVYRERRTHHDVPIGAYVGVPVVFADGSLYGTVCGIKRSAAGPDLMQQSALLELMGTLLSHVLSAEQAGVDLARQLEVTREQADTDPFTGLLNRRSWRRLCDVEEGRHQALGDPLSVLVVDLDGLKAVNDQHGHDVGDELIMLTARVLGATSRAGDSVARLGGDEFGVLCPHTTGSQVEHLAERFRAAFEAVDIRASIGTGTMHVVGSVRDAQTEADRQMYAAKQRHRPALP